ncbi:MAG: hypothetical protein NTU62_16580 [Spirochaetes bacterium]|nr:hypothetical protein [Spirochaetota bacterium]
MSGRRTGIFPVLLLALLAPCAASPASAGGAPANLAANSGFEREELGSVAMRSTSAWLQTDEAVRFFVTSDAKHAGSRSFAIANLQPNNSRAVQWIAVKPDTYYRLSCWIRAQGVDTPSIGANISVLGATAAAGDLRDTGSSWQLLELYGKTGPKQQAIAVAARLGFHGSLATGLALFDDSSVEELPKPSAAKVVANLDTRETVVVQSLPPAPSGTASPAWLQSILSFTWLRTLFTPPWLYLVVTVLPLLVLAAIIVAVFALASALVTRRYGPAVAAPSGRIPITALISGFASRSPQAGRPRGGRRRGAAHEIEHRGWARDPLEAPITVRRRRKDAGVDTFRMRTVNASGGRLFLASGDTSLLGLDDEVNLEVLRENAKVELGRACVVRAGRDGFALRFGSPNARIRRLLRGVC